MGFYDDASPTQWMPLRTNQVELRGGSTSNRAGLVNANFWGFNNLNYFRFGSTADANGASDLQFWRGGTERMDITTSAKSTTAFGDLKLRYLNATSYVNPGECAGGYIAGDLCYNSTDNKHYGYNGTALNALY